PAGADLPWAILSFPHGPRPDKALPPRLVIFATDGACSKGASGAFALSIRRVDTAATPVSAKPSVGGGDGRAAPGGRVTPVGGVAASKFGDRDGEFLWLSCPNRFSPPGLSSRKRFRL